ncbi:DivIVA domain-containing protein [Protaetiibacter intestinalis]|uniref:DivIVA domain-containing protein n=1 Tax=Protaetiibacter intestinalis TaxID=2419774 RepID=A0A387BCZ8_9MICO|nr:DivIVA domain-containing protein [Protaetiibacter intestinalis]AYF99548.1 DivIVA domain-containing protein [Protaetiibacter intestinalis]
MTFPRARKGRLGYDIDEVEEFLEDARRAYTADHPDATLVNADSIRTTAFSMRKSGYSTTHVDAALERLEDAFAAREREREIAQLGEEGWYAQARETAQAILDRSVRPAGKRFQRVSILTVGYSVRDVDAFADRIAGYFQSGEALTPEDVRTVAFRPQRGGYREAQVDLLLDTVTRVMLAVR